MNKEEIENALKCLEMDMLDNTQIELLLNYIDKLQKENEELKEELEKYEQLVGFTTIRIKPEDIKVVTDKFISKDIIRNKIKELDTETGIGLELDKYEINGARVVLNKLLGE